MRLSLLIAVVLAATAPAPPPASAAAVPRFGHVFLIVGENTSYGQVTAGRAPYVARTLRRRGAWLSNYRTFAHSKSLGQYIAMVSGQYNGCEAANASPDTCRQSVPNLFAQLEATGRTWRTWSESMPAPCTSSNAGGYIAHHNPALYFTAISSTCASGSVPMGGRGARDTSSFDAALAQGDVGDFNLVVPNNCENGHDACGGDPVRHFDAFLAREVPRIQASPAFGSDGVIVVTWDEGGDAPYDPTHVATVVLGPLVRRGAVDRARHDHYGLERTLAAGLGVAPLARARRAAPISGIWR